MHFSLWIDKLFLWKRLPERKPIHLIGLVFLRAIKLLFPKNMLFAGSKNAVVDLESWFKNWTFSLYGLNERDLSIVVKGQSVLGPLVFFNLEIFSFLLKSWFSDPKAKDLHLLDIEISCLGNKREKLQMTASWTFISTACYVKLEFNPYCVAKAKKIVDVPIPINIGNIFYTKKHTANLKCSNLSAEYICVNFKLRLLTQCCTNQYETDSNISCFVPYCNIGICYIA